ncbi:MAG: alpha/beta hydrolase-fold protein [Xanthomonadales bacterium]|jgi:hypothetical protein|nr:alpha/beta hydrolase-fold protein [Xanthomonadales bacterium]
MHRLFLAGLIAVSAIACRPAADAPTMTPAAAPATLAASAEPAPTPPAASTEPTRAPASGQRSGGLPYELLGTEVHDVADPVSGRRYQIFVALPPSYASNPERRYPALYVTDADYGFPVLRQIARRLNGHGARVEEFVLVGLSYAVGEDSMDSRRRDYTPTAKGAHDAPGALHGQAAAYADYVRDQVIPAVAARYRVDDERRIYVGHSYGGLLGMQILLTRPETFSGYLIGSPSLWYDQHVMFDFEARYAAAHPDLAASVYLYVGEYEDMKPGDPRFAKRHNMVRDARRMARQLDARQYPSLDLKLDVLNDEDHLSVAPRGFSKGLMHLLAAPE